MTMLSKCEPHVDAVSWLKLACQLLSQEPRWLSQSLNVSSKQRRLPAWARLSVRPLALLYPSVDSRVWNPCLASHISSLELYLAGGPHNLYWVCCHINYRMEPHLLAMSNKEILKELVKRVANLYSDIDYLQSIQHWAGHKECSVR